MAIYQAKVRIYYTDYIIVHARDEDFAIDEVEKAIKDELPSGVDFDFDCEELEEQEPCEI